MARYQWTATQADRAGGGQWLVVSAQGRVGMGRQIIHRAAHLFGPLQERQKSLTLIPDVVELQPSTVPIVDDDVAPTPLIGKLGDVFIANRPGPLPRASNGPSIGQVVGQILWVHGEKKNEEQW